MRLGGFRPGLRLDGISIHAPREGCDPYALWLEKTGRVISIHAPREGCDTVEMLYCRMFVISIHAPREGCDEDDNIKLKLDEFQSTHPVRGATRYEDIMTVSGFNFNPRTP